MKTIKPGRGKALSGLPAPVAPAPNGGRRRPAGRCDVVTDGVVALAAARAELLLDNALKHSAAPVLGQAPPEHNEGKFVAVFDALFTLLAIAQSSWVRQDLKLEGGAAGHPQASQLARLAVALDCGISDLTNPGRLSGSPKCGDRIKDGDELALLMFWRGLTKDERGRMLKGVIKDPTTLTP